MSYPEHNYVLELDESSGSGLWRLAHEPNTAVTLDEARQLYNAGNFIGTKTRAEPSSYRIRDIRSQKVYTLFEATEDLPKVQPEPTKTFGVQTPDGIVAVTTNQIPTEVIGGAFPTKTSGVRESIGKMVRSPAADKPNFTLIFRGPMLVRWAELLTRGAVVYGADNWLEGLREADPANRKAIKERYLESASRHYVQWLRGDKDEDHAAAVFFNINGYEAMVWTDNIVTRKERLAELDRLVT